MRRDLIATGDPSLSPLDGDLRHLLASWFNRGFLVLRRIDWHTPATILDKIIAYEAVHEIQGWDDLRRRLDPDDRTCFAFFHPSLVDEPLIFVEVALTSEIPGSIGEVLCEAPKNGEGAGNPTTAVFYSISNCQEGLRGISFGNFLIKQVAEDLLKERPSLKTFVTLSPVPNFAEWLDAALASNDSAALVTPAERERLAVLSDPDWASSEVVAESLKPLLLRLAAGYFLNERASDGRPLDSVARFHLGNGARLERINWLGDTSPKGLTAAHGLMVNYRYELKDIEKNHEAYANEGFVTASRQVHALLKRAKSRPEPATTTTKLLQIARLRPPKPDGEQAEGG
jgi:malonyl-CoA decarboxylase